MEAAIDIRRVGRGELGALQSLSRQTFAETFAEKNTPENLKQYLDVALSLEQIGREWGSEGSEFYFALQAGAPVGYLKLNHGSAQTEGQHPDGLEIERIYVLRSHQGRQIGKLLYEVAMRRAEERGADYLWLGVWEQNVQAIGFYQRLGFEAFGSHGFQLGEDLQTDILMRKSVAKGR